MRSNAELAYTKLREMAVNYELPPGSRVNEVWLSQRLGMSRVPIREALNRLVSEGLVRSSAGIGFIGRHVEAPEVCELYDIRADLEAGALHRAAVAGADTGGLAALEATTKRILKAPGRYAIRELIAEDEAFHMALANLAPNPEREVILRNVNARVRFVRRMNLETAVRRRQAFEEHHAILQALLKNDWTSAVNLLRSHLAVSAEKALGLTRAAQAVLASRSDA